MKTKAQYLISTVSIVSLLAINYYVSSTTIKYNFPEAKPVIPTEYKKIDKVEIKGSQNQIARKTNSIKQTHNLMVSAPSLFELSNQLGAPIITNTETAELSYPE